MDLDDLKKAAAELTPALAGDTSSSQSGWGPLKDEATSRRTDFLTVDGADFGPPHGSFENYTEKDREIETETGSAKPPAAPALNQRPPSVGSVRAVNIQGSNSADLVKEAIKGEYRYAMLGLILGLASIVGGIIMGLHGVAGSTSWTASALGLSSSVNDATPGVILFIVGLFMVWVTKAKVKLKDIKG
jgi:hypothetical protein